MGDIDFTILRVLVIDDETFTRQIIDRLLYELGIDNVTMASDGLDAMTKFSMTIENFDLVICDLKMPNMDGFEFVKLLREKTQLPSKNVPVLIVTGYSGEDIVQKSVQSGIHGYLVKPVTKTQLEKRIVMALTSPGIDPEILKLQGRH